MTASRYEQQVNNVIRSCEKRLEWLQRGSRKTFGILTAHKVSVCMCVCVCVRVCVCVCVCVYVDVQMCYTCVYVLSKCADMYVNICVLNIKLKHKTVTYA